MIDPAARGRGQKDGEALFDAYTGLGLTLMAANNAVESGIYEVWSRLSTQRLKVFKTLQNFRQEYRIYRRDEKGKIVKENDHLLDCARYMCVSGVALAAPRPAELWKESKMFPPKGLHTTGYDPMAEAWGVAKMGRR